MRAVHEKGSPGGTINSRDILQVSTYAICRHTCVGPHLTQILRPVKVRFDGSNWVWALNMVTFEVSISKYSVSLSSSLLAS